MSDDLRQSSYLHITPVICPDCGAFLGNYERYVDSETSILREARTILRAIDHHRENGCEGVQNG